MHPKGLLSLLYLLGLLVFNPLWAQEEGRDTRINGVVTDLSGQPLEAVEVTVGNFYTLTNAQGQYDLEINPGENLTAYFTLFGYKPDTTRFSIEKGAKLSLSKKLELFLNVLEGAEIVDKKSRFENQISVRAKDLETFVGPGSSVEGIIKTLPGVSSYNELSSQYSVRGGNFDENLVYVNGIEIFRPFLVRNGQQEGLSFINSAMVKDIDFSAGGFEARYGDKMSSVLDITYKRPNQFSLTAEGSLMGGNLVYGDAFANNRLNVLVGARYRTNQLILGTLDTDADFRPQFTDVQAYLTYALTDEWDLTFLGNFARNVYEVIPSSRTTDFGTFQEALRLNVFFDGREDYDFTTRFGALGASYQPNKNLRLNFNTSAYQSTEQEYFDVVGAYRLGELNRNLGSDEFGEISFTRGIGGFQNFARNNLDAVVANLNHTGIYDKDAITWRWGAKIQYEDIIDRYKEWERIDSAGFNVPNQSGYFEQFFRSGDSIFVVSEIRQEDSIKLFESFESDASVQSMRLTGYVERSQVFDTRWGDIFVNAGMRTHFWSYNQQNVISPRASFSWNPDWKKADMVFRLASGFYYQPPFYREMRNLEGGLNQNIRAQRSIHFVLANDYQLRIWNRPFKMVTELYYKQLNDLIPYDLDNVRIRYRAVNNASGYAAGFDYRINGEFVKGVDSWASLSLMTIQEDIEGDGAGFLPRPTDQRANFKIFFQDYFPNDPTFRVSLTLVYGTGLPFGPPQATAAERIYRLPDYRRVDIGFSKVLKAEGKNYDWSFLNHFKSMWVGIEVFNLLDINNTISYLWVRDISTARQYAVPNFLTGRIFNVKLVTKF
jgi:hypothetical protein